MANCRHCGMFWAVVLCVLGLASANWPFGIPHEHEDSECNRTALEFPHHREVDVTRVPDELTEECPTTDWSGAPPGEQWQIGQRTRVFFKNAAGVPVDLFWVDEFSGKEQYLHTLEPNQVSNQETQQGHVFHARRLQSEGGKLLVRHRAGLLVFENTLETPCADIEFKKQEKHCNDPDFVPPEAPKTCWLLCNYIHQGFVNRAGCAINLWYWNGTAEELVAQLGTQPVNHVSDYNQFGMAQSMEGTYLTHAFRARMPDGKLVQERQIDRVQITDCISPLSPPGTVFHPALLYPVAAMLDKANQTVVLDSATCSTKRGGLCETGGREGHTIFTPRKSHEEQGSAASQEKVACLDGPCNLSPSEFAKQIIAGPSALRWLVASAIAGSQIM